MESPDWEHIEKQARYMVNLLEHQTPSPLLLGDTTTPELVSLDSPISKTPSAGLKEKIKSSNGTTVVRHPKPSLSVKFPLQPDAESDDSGLLDIRNAQIPHLEDLNDDSPAVNQDLLEHSKKYDLETCGASSLNSTFSVEDDGIVQANLPEISPERSSGFSVDAVIENCKVMAAGISENGPLSSSGPNEVSEVVLCEQQKRDAPQEQFVSDLNCDQSTEEVCVKVDQPKSLFDVHSDKAGAAVMVSSTLDAATDNNITEADGIGFPVPVASTENNVNEAVGIVPPPLVAAENNVNEVVGMASAPVTSETDVDEAEVKAISTPAVTTKISVNGKASPAVVCATDNCTDEGESKLRHAQCSKTESGAGKITLKRCSSESTLDGQETGENPDSFVSGEDISTVRKPALDKGGIDKSVAAAEPANKNTSKVPPVSRLPFRRSVSGLPRAAGPKGSTSKSTELEPVMVKDNVLNLPKKEKPNTRYSLSEFKAPSKTTETRKQSVPGLRKVQSFRQPAGVRNVKEEPIKSQLPLAPGKIGTKKPTVKNVSTNVKSGRTTRESLMPVNGSKLMTLRKQVSVLPKGPMKVTHPATQSQTVSKDSSRFPLKAIQPAHGSKAVTKTAEKTVTQTSVPADGSKTVARPSSSNTAGKDAGKESVQGIDGSKTVTKVPSSEVNQAKVVGAGDTPMKTDIGLNPRNLADVFQRTPTKSGLSGKRKKTFLPTPTRGSSSSSVSSISSMESPFFNRGSNCSEDEDPFKPKRFLVQNTPDLEPRRMSMWSPIHRREGIPDEEKAFQCTKRKAPRMALHQQ